MSSAATKQYASPNPPIPDAATRRGQAAYEALTNIKTGGPNAAPIGPANAVKQAAAVLTSRTGGDVRVVGTIAGVASVAGDIVDVQLTEIVNGGGETPIGPVQKIKSGAASGEFSASVDFFATLGLGATAIYAIRATNEAGGDNVTVAAGQAYISAQEQPA